MREKISSISISIATGIVFLIWQLLLTIKNEYVWIVPLITMLISYGIYKAITFTCLKLIIKSKLIKRFLLGKEYIEGVWYGAYVGPRLEPRIFIEEYEQNPDGISVKGRSFLLNGSPHAMWTSTSFNYFNENKEVFFTYCSHSFTEETTGNGYAQFTAVIDNRIKTIVELRGFTFDLQNGIMVPSLERKLDGKLVDKIEEKEILVLATRFYSENIEFFNKHKSIIEQKVKSNQPLVTE